jgi:hypothetical protein
VMFTIEHVPNIWSIKCSMIFANIDRMCSCTSQLCDGNPTLASHCMCSQGFSTIESTTHPFMMSNTKFFMSCICTMSLALYGYFIPKNFVMDEGALFCVFLFFVNQVQHHLLVLLIQFYIPPSL